MPPKRSSDGSSPASKRQRTSTQDEEPRVNRIYGQTGAFPGLDEESSGDAASPDAQVLPDDPIRYLRCVRAQAARIPNLLTSSKADAIGSGVVYGDSAIVAAPFIGPPPPPKALKTVRFALPEVHHKEEENEEESDARKEAMPARAAHYKRLISQYKRTQARTQSSPPPQPPGSAGSEPIDLEHRSVAKCIEYLYSTHPTPRVLASLDQDDSLAGLVALANRISWRKLTDEDVGKRLQVWCWGLLCRVDAREAGYQDVGKVRELGKKARILLERAPSLPRPAEETVQPTADDNTPIEVGEEPVSETKMLKQMKDAVHMIDSKAHPNAPSKILTWASQSAGLSDLCEAVEEHGADIDHMLEPEDLQNFRVVIETADEECRNVFKKAGFELDRLDEQGSAEDQQNARPSEDQQDGTAQEAETEQDGDGRLMSAFATLDMILTIVAEVFGQRDLLAEPGGRDVCWHSE